MIESQKLLISIVIPVYNHAHTLERCLRSIEGQTYRPIEVIIVDDGSTDSLSEVLNKLQFNFSPTVIRQENMGAAAARNRGFKEATGEYIIFWDADTLARPEMLEKLLRALEGDKTAAYAYCRFKFGWKKMKSQEFNGEDLKSYNYIDTTSLVRRNVLSSLLEGGAGEVLGNALQYIPTPLFRGDASGPFDESLKRFQDWDLWLTLLEQGKSGVFVSEVLYTKIVHGRKGMSSWLPRFWYRLPWRGRATKEYERAKEIVLRKHRLV
ncbi:MAG TPA: glycosyltransferase family A protein [Patescibacteria group bacterium]|nr:glycosyltransferase family A protein [Patescibacteria group bacterium]